MTGGEHRDPEVRRLLFGFDLENLYLRLDLATPAGQKLAHGFGCSVSFTAPADHRLVITGTSRGSIAELQRKAADGGWTPIRDAAPMAAAGEILEVSVPFADLGLQPNMSFAFFVTIHNRTIELERHPAHRPVSTSVPEATFEGVNWKA
jgi:hypothetical protein